MNTATATQLEDSFLAFFKNAHRAMEIESEEDYRNALELVEFFMSKAEDKKGEPLLLLVDMISDCIEKYELEIERVQNFVTKIKEIDPGVSTLRIMIDQHGLSYSDLKDEIGSKSLVSQILNGSKNLTKAHIQKLSERFQIGPELFF